MQAGEVSLYENLNALSRAYLVYDWTTVADRAQALEALRQPTFDPARRAVIVAAAGLPASPPGATIGTPGRTSLRESRPGRVRYEVDTAAPALLVVSNWYYPGWRARVGGGAATIFQANYVLQAVYVPPGITTVELTYEPTALAAGARITLAALAVLGLWAGSVGLARAVQARSPRPVPAFGPLKP